MRDTLYAHVKPVRALNTSSITTNTSTNGAAVDLDQSGADFRVAMFVMLAGTITDGSYACNPQESADGSTGWTDVPAARLQGSATITASHQVKQVGVIPDPGAARYLRIQVVSTSVTTGGAVSGVVLLGSPSALPVVQS